MTFCCYIETRRRLVAKFGKAEADKGKEQRDQDNAKLMERVRSAFDGVGECAKGIAGHRSASQAHTDNGRRDLPRGQTRKKSRDRR